MRAVNWDAAGLVIFDLDGTLYDQRRLRARMATDLLADAARDRSLTTLRVLRTFRRCREALALDPGAAFLSRQFSETAALTGVEEDTVRRIVVEWIERRPLARLRACRCDGVEVVFAGLRRTGRRIAIFSDHAASRKIEALGLEADIVVSAVDPDVARLKPNPAGLHKILRATRFSAGEALMIGDRFDRDFAAAAAVGMPALVRSRGSQAPCPTFRSYRDAVFAPILGARSGTPAFGASGPDLARESRSHAA